MFSVLPDACCGSLIPFRTALPFLRQLDSNKIPSVIRPQNGSECGSKTHTYFF